MCDIPLLRGSEASAVFACVTRHVHTWGVTESCVRHDSSTTAAVSVHTHVRITYESSHTSNVCDMTHLQLQRCLSHTHTRIICESSHTINMCDMTHLQLQRCLYTLTSRFTSRPEARGSGVEAVFRFLGSGVDSRGKKGRKGSEGRELGSGVRLQCKTSPM